MSAHPSPTVEVVYIPSSEDFRHDPSLLESTLQITKDAPGCLGIYWGLQLEDKETLYLIVVWNTYEEHYDLINDKSVYPTLQKDLARCRSGQPNMFHIPFSPNPAKALNASVTAFTHVYGLKSGKSGNDLKQALASVSGNANGGTVGKLIERDEYVFMFGVEGHSDVGQSLSQDLSGIATKVENAHVKLTPYYKYEP